MELLDSKKEPQCLFSVLCSISFAKSGTSVLFSPVSLHGSTFQQTRFQVSRDGRSKSHIFIASKDAKKGALWTSLH